MHDFISAFGLLKQGQKITRDAWQGRDAWILMQNLIMPGSDVKRPFIYMNVDGKLNPWEPKQIDLVTEDWVVVPL